MNEDCYGCLLPIALNIKQPQERIAQTRIAAEKFMKEMEKHDTRKMKLRDYFITHFENNFLLNHCFNPYVVGHLVLQPINHITHLHEPYRKSENTKCMKETEVPKFFLIASKVSKLLEESLKEQGYPPEKVYLCTFNESSDWHLHLHIVPRAKQEVIIGPRLLAESRRKITRAEIETIVKALKEKLLRKSGILQI